MMNVAAKITNVPSVVLTSMLLFVQLELNVLMLIHVQEEHVPLINVVMVVVRIILAHRLVITIIVLLMLHVLILNNALPVTVVELTLIKQLPLNY